MNKMDIFKYPMNDGMFSKDIKQIVDSFKLNVTFNGNCINYEGLNDSGKTTRCLYDSMKSLFENQSKHLIIVHLYDESMPLELLCKHISPVNYYKVTSRIHKVRLESLSTLKSYRLREIDVDLMVDIERELSFMEINSIKTSVKDIDIIRTAIYPKEGSIL